MPEAVPEPGPPVSQNISELVRQLTREDRGQYLYRGQTKHYGVVTPSTFRRALTGEPCEIEHLRRISTEAFNRALTTEQSRLRFDLLEYLITSLGRAVGNIIAQQYGITSEAIDVTSSIEVAAFFATHDYPSYQHFNGTADRPLGVIYRFPNFTKVRDLGRIERCLEEMGHIGRHGRDVWFERCPKLFELSGENRERAYRYLDQHEREDAILFSPPMVVDYRALTEPLEEALKDAWKLTPRWLQHTRLGRQVGGFVLPPVHWRCVLPRKKQIIEAEILLRHDYYEPGTAFREEIVAIEDTMNFPGIETFFFKHSEDRAESMTKEYLWPSSQDDDVYAHLLERCLHEREIVEYLEREDIWAEHPEKGIIDRGYYTGHEMLGWKAQVAYQDGRLDDALQLASTALAEEPDNPVMLVLRSAASTQLNRRADAIRDLDRVLLSNPDNWNALNNKGHLLRKEGDIAGALQAFDMAISVNPMVAELYLNRSDLLGEDLNQFDLAISDLDYALTELPQLTPQQRVILLQAKALALTAWDKDKDEEAEAVLSELKEIAEGWGIVDVKPLIRHIHGMRQQRLSINRSPTSTRSSKPT